MLARGSNLNLLATEASCEPERASAENVLFAGKFYGVKFANRKRKIEFK